MKTVWKGKNTWAVDMLQKAVDSINAEDSKFAELDAQFNMLPGLVLHFGHPTTGGISWSLTNVQAATFAADPLAPDYL